jgi:hypothetical protein
MSDRWNPLDCSDTGDLFLAPFVPPTVLALRVNAQTTLAALHSVDGASSNVRRMEFATCIESPEPFGGDVAAVWIFF